jgi:hypothetical protein
MGMKIIINASYPAFCHKQSLVLIFVVSSSEGVAYL